MHGVGELANIEGRLTADKYIEILEEVMLPSVRAYALPYPERIIFMQDNAPIHTARTVRRWIEEQPDVEVLPWPSKSCDLNPIENVWGNIARTWESGMERSARNLFTHTVQAWEAYRGKPQIIHNHVASMPKRLQQVIEKQGGWTKY